MHGVRTTRQGLAGLAVGLLLLSAAQPVRAGIIAFTFPDPREGPASVTGNDGFQFQPTLPIQVTSLGYYDRFQDGLTLIHPVAIFDVATKTILAVTDVGPGSTLEGLFRYNAIAPLSLNVGQSYMVVGFHPGSDTDDFAAYNPAGLTIAPQLKYEGYWLNFFSSLILPHHDDSPNMFFGPNFQFQERQVIIPEPTSLTLLGIGTLGLVGYNWRRQRRAGAQVVLA